MNERKDDIWYCSEEHLLLHRKSNVDKEAQCYPIKVLTNETVGRYENHNRNIISKYQCTALILQDTLLSRYIVATRDIRAGEIIFEESPLAVGPNAVSTPQCIMCHSKVCSTYSVLVYDDDIS